MNWVFFYSLYISKLGFFSFLFVRSFPPHVLGNSPQRVIGASAIFLSFRIILLYLIWKFLWGNFRSAPETLRDEKAPIS